MTDLVTINTILQYESPFSSSWKVMAKVKVFQKRVKPMVKVTRSKIIVPIKRFCHKEYTYEISFINGLKVVAKVKILSTHPTRTCARAMT